MLNRDLGFFEPPAELKMKRYGSLDVEIPPIAHRPLFRAVTS